jgi:hypothetical protein
MGPGINGKRRGLAYSFSCLIIEASQGVPVAAISGNICVEVIRVVLNKNGTKILKRGGRVNPS